jgi:hypothetical protein
MSELVFNKETTPSNAAANKAKVYYNSTDLAMEAIDENGNNRILAKFATNTFRLVKVTDVFQGTTTYTPTSGVNALYVEAIGGGAAGGGGATSSGNLSLGSGGGGGAYSAIFITSPKASYACVIGAGGAGVNGTTGGVGTDTTFDSPSICTAKGGAGGTTLAAGTSVVTQNGAAGGASGSGVGDIKMDGGDGGWGIRLSASVGQGGQGGISPMSGAAVGSNAVGVGGAGKQYGGGGGGAMTTGTQNVGGAGANGLLRIWEFI